MVYNFLFLCFQERKSDERKKADRVNAVNDHKVSLSN